MSVIYAIRLIVTAIKDMKVNKNIKNAPFYIFCAVIVLPLLLGVGLIRFGGGKYDNQMYLATRDRGWDAVKLIKADDVDSITKAKEEFNKNISRIKESQPPLRILGFIISKTSYSDDFGKNKYVEIYTDFYNGPFFSYWKDISTKHIHRTKLYDEAQSKDRKRSSYEYVNETTKALSNEIYDINAEIEKLDKEIANLQSKADNEYSDFTARLDAYMAKSIDIKYSK